MAEIKIESDVADLSNINKQAQKIGALLRDGSVLELLPEGLAERFSNALFEGAAEELYRVSGVITDGAGNLTMTIDAAGVFLELVAALRALGFDVD